MKPTIVALCAGILVPLLGACAATPTAMMADVQDAEPLYSGSFPGNYESLSACVALAWGREPIVWDLRQVIDAPNETAVVQGNYRVFMSAYPMHKTLRQADDATVAVDFRQTPGAKEAPEWVWQAVENCAHKGA